MNAITDTILQHQDSDLYFTFKATGDPDAGLVVRSFRSEEATSTLYRIEVDLASERSDIDLTKLLDKPAHLTIHDRYGEPRYLHGLVEEVHLGDTGDHHTFYRAVLMPSLHRLRFISDARIFQKQSVPQIVESVLKTNGVNDYSFDLRANHVTRDYVVQYRETSLAFVERLLAEEGIHYTHEHSDSGHHLVMRDMSRVAADVPATASMEYNANPGGDVKGSFVRTFARVERVESSQAALADQHFLHPRYTFPSVYESSRTNGLTRTLEHYEFPGRHKSDETGAAFAKYRLEHFRSLASTGRGVGRFAHATAGALFDLTDHPSKTINRKYFLTRVVQSGRQPGALEEDTGSEMRADNGGAFLDTTFEVVSSDQPWRPAQRVKPMADGPHLAIVTGPPGEEIYTDEYSRVKVRFFWDRHARNDDTSSCWIRVAQNWGGARWGHIAIPRIGQSVLVSYVNDDIDQPLITGRAYNADNHTPYALPGNKTKMAIRSQTHKGPGFNEISFEDENGAQNLFMHAQKDMTSKVLNNQIHTVDASGFHSYGEHHQLTVSSNMNQQVGGGLNQVVGSSTGSGAQSLMSGALGALMNQSAGMLQTAMGIAAQAAGGGANDDASRSTNGNGGNAAANHSAGLASAALGAAPGAADQALSAATSVTASTIARIGGASIASAGTSLLGALGSLIGGGVFNQLVSMMKNTSVGVASTEQVGVSKILSVGQVLMETIGHTHKITVGDNFTIECGKSKLTMDKDGNVVILGTQFHFEASGNVQVRGKVIDHN